MNICFLLGGLYGGGIGRVTSFVANALEGRENNKIFMLCYSKPENGEVYEISNNIKKDYLLHKHTNMRQAIKGHVIRNLRAYLKENEIDILISCGVMYSLISILACKKENVICVNWEHTSMNTQADFRFQSIIRWFGAHFSDINVVLTKETEKEYRKKYHLKQDKILQIYNPVDPIAYNSEKYSMDSKKIISVGRLCYQKKMEDAILVAEKVLSCHPNWTWDIYGEGDDYEKLSNLIKEKCLQDKVFLMGRKNDIYKRYKDYSFMVMTSRYEGFPMTLLEAAANRLPMISYDIQTGPKEIVETEKNGYLIPYGNIEMMIKGINQIIENPSKREEMSNNSYEKSKQFDLNSITSAWEKLFIKLGSKNENI